jgi:purine nucleosidase
MQTRRLIIDCDPGVDDAIALLMALASPSLELIAITTVAGNVPVETTCSNARRICELARCLHTPIYAGCPRPLVRSPIFAAEVHGEDGLGGVALPDSQVKRQSDHAVDVLIRLCRSSQQTPLTIAALGPLTNLAVALVKAPDIVRGIEQIVMMGGAVAGGNITPFAEFNCYADPHAAHVVLTSRIPTVLIPLEVTHQVIATPEWRSQLKSAKSSVSRTVAQMLDNYGTQEQRDRRWCGPPIHDPCVIGYLLAPELFSTAPADVSIDLSNSDTCGQTVILWDSLKKTMNPIEVVCSIQSEAFLQHLERKLTGFR